MNRKCIVLLLALLLIPTIVFAWIDTSHMDGSYPIIGGGWSCIDSGTGYGAIVSDSTSPDPSTVLKLTYPAGFYNGNYAAKCWNMLPGSTTPSVQYTELWVQYYFKYSSNYYFHPVDNKQTYYFTGGSNSANNWYISVNGSHHVNVVTQTFNTDRHLPNTGYDPVINAGQWYKMRARFVMNTPGVLNGILQIWINDQLVINKSTVGYISQAEGIREVQIAPVFGGNTGVSKPAEDYQYYELFTISTSPINGGGPYLSNPMPPSRLQIQ